MTRKNPAAVALGKKGGNARAKKLTKKRRQEIARMGGLARARNCPRTAGK
jgi:general stress protein YciG